jgi:biopolymer transport protein ExbD
LSRQPGSINTTPVVPVVLALISFLLVSAHGTAYRLRNGSRSRRPVLVSVALSNRPPPAL